MGRALPPRPAPVIQVPAGFPEIGRLLGCPKKPDPRSRAFASDGLDLDLRSWGYVRSTAVLWSAVYSLLARQRGVPCRLLEPEDVSVRGHLQSTGIERCLLEVGVGGVDGGASGAVAASVVLPLTRFRTLREVEILTDRALEILEERLSGAVNIRPVITEAFAELAMNVVQHADSEIGGLALIQASPVGKKQRLECAVADGGVGVRSALLKNPELRRRISHDWDALDLATRERISGTADASRGIGLFGVAEDMRKGGRQLLLHSGNGMLQIDERAQLQARRKPFFPGTLACVRIPI